MKAIRIHEHGTAGVLQVDDLEMPRPAKDEVLIQVKAAALNHLDLWVRRGIPGVSLPMIMGSDCAGVITDVGESARQFGFNQGDHVIHIPIRSCGVCPACLSGNENLCLHFNIPGEHAPGVQSEFLAIPARYLVRKPEDLSWAEAAALPLAGMTAYHMLMQKTAISSDNWVLVWGASSGVGSAAIQIAKAAGARVITTAGSAEKAEWAKKSGADHVILYKETSVGRMVREITGGRGVDVVIEHSGEMTWNESLRSLNKGGKIITCGATTGAVVRIDLRAVFIKQQQIIGSTMGTPKDMQSLLELVRQGKFRPVVSKLFSYQDVRPAHEYLEQGNQIGKVVLLFD